jgi:CheY-like chemotaxis protein
MSESANYQILVVDDEDILRDTVAMIMRHGGYKVSTARNGIDALLQMRRVVPDLIISDLNMPEMSGFEFLSVVRRRFPEVAVIAKSGAYRLAETVPGGVIADAFYAKGQHDPAKLLGVVAGLLADRQERGISHRRLPAPVWIPRNGKNSAGVPFILLNCTECLRSFPLSVTTENLQEVQETTCPSCHTVVRYIIDFSRSVYSPPRDKGAS